MTIMPFHLSIPVSDLTTARRFYGELLGCSEGRSADKRVDYNFFGHHLVAHLEPNDASHKTTDIDSFGIKTPARHFGVVVTHDEFQRLAKRLAKAKAHFYSEPQTVFPGEVKEQDIMLVHDDCGNVVEFKASKFGLFDKEKKAD